MVKDEACPPSQLRFFPSHPISALLRLLRPLRFPDNYIASEPMSFDRRLVLMNTRKNNSLPCRQSRQRAHQDTKHFPNYPNLRGGGARSCRNRKHWSVAPCAVTTKGLISPAKAGPRIQIPPKLAAIPSPWHLYLRSNYAHPRDKVTPHCGQEVLGR